MRDLDQGTLALEIEWNNKDPFFDRDLENFHWLHAESAISLGIIVTRGQSLQAAVRQILFDRARGNGLEGLEDFDRLGIKEPTTNQRQSIERRLESMDFPTAAATMLAAKYGESTTHWNKLMERLARGVGSPCPLLLIGLPVSCVKIVDEGRQR